MACARVIQPLAALAHPRRARQDRVGPLRAQRRDLDCMDYKEVPRIQDYHRLVRRLQMRVIQLENELRVTQLVYKESVDMLAAWQSEPVPAQHGSLDADMTSMNEL